MNKKIFILTTVAMLAILTSSMIGISFSGANKKTKPEYVRFSLEYKPGPRTSRNFIVDTP